LEDVTGSGRESLANGWRFNRAAPWEASIVTFRKGENATVNNYYFEATRAKLNFTFDQNGKPQAYLSFSYKDKAFVHPLILPVFSPKTGPDYSFFTPDSVPITWADIDLEEYDLFTFYDENNSEKALKCEKVFENKSFVEGAAQAERPCGFGTKTTKYRNGINAVVGGFKIDEFNQTYGYASSETINTTTETNTFQYEYPQSDLTTAFSSCGSCGADDLLNTQYPDIYYYNFPGVVRRYGLRNQDYETNTVTRSEIHRYAAIPYTDAESVALVTDARVTELKRWSKTYHDANALPQGIKGLEYIYSVIEYKETQNGPLLVDPFNCTVENKFDAFWSGTVISETGNDPYREYYESDVYIVTSIGSFRHQKNDDRGVGQYTGYNSVMAYTSGGSYFLPGTLEHKVLDGYSDLNAFRWIGDA
jgi:hypothetical protein